MHALVNVFNVASNGCHSAALPPPVIIATYNVPIWARKIRVHVHVHVCVGGTGRKLSVISCTRLLHGAWVII